MKKSEKSFMLKVRYYLKASSPKREFLLRYRAEERKKRLEDTANNIRVEVEIEGNELVEENLRERRVKRSVK